MLNIILNILTSGLPCCLLAVGIFLTYRLLDFADLTAEGSFLLGAALSAVLINLGVNPFLATLAALGVGALCGIITGVLNRLLKIPKLLSGIITLTASASIVLVIFGLGTSRPFFSQVSIDLSKPGVETIFSIFNSTLKAPWKRIVESGIMVAIVAIVIAIVYYFFGTEYGMAIRATGINEKMARAQGINTNISTITCIAISNGLIGLGGALYAQDSLGVGTLSGAGYLVIGLASILIGETIFGKRSFKNHLLSVTLGAIVYFIIITLAVLLGLPTELKSLLYAILIAIALVLPLIREKIQQAIDSFKKRKGKEIC